MDMAAIRAIAKEKGVNAPDTMKKTELVREIQRVEGYSQCFGTNKVDCDQSKCLWRMDCIEPARTCSAKPKACEAPRPAVTCAAKPKACEAPRPAETCKPKACEKPSASTAPAAVASPCRKEARKASPYKRGGK